MARRADQPAAVTPAAPGAQQAPGARRVPPTADTSISRAAPVRACAPTGTQSASASMGSRSAYDVARPAAPAVRGGAAAPAAASTTLKDGGVSPWAAPARLEESASSTVRARRAAVREVSAAKIACRIPAFIGAQFPVPPASASRRHSPVHANPVAPRVSLVACPRSRLFPSRLVLPRSDATPATVRAARRPDVACARRAFTRRSSRRRKRASARPRPSLDPFRGRGWRPRGRRSGGSGRLLPRVSSRFRRRLP